MNLYNIITKGRRCQLDNYVLKYCDGYTMQCETIIGIKWNKTLYFSLNPGFKRNKENEVKNIMLAHILPSINAIGSAASPLPIRYTFCHISNATDILSIFYKKINYNDVLYNVSLPINLILQYHGYPLWVYTFKAWKDFGDFEGQEGGIIGAIRRTV